MDTTNVITSTSARPAAQVLLRSRDASLATPEFARQIIDGKSDALKATSARRATAARDMLEILRAYRTVDVTADPDRTFQVALARQIIKQLADRLNGNDAVAIAEILEALVDHPFRPAMLADYFTHDAVKRKRREQNRQAQQRSRARKAGAK